MAATLVRPWVGLYSGVSVERLSLGQPNVLRCGSKYRWFRTIIGLMSQPNDRRRPNARRAVTSCLTIGGGLTRVRT
jgi:hypothetical protein